MARDHTLDENSPENHGRSAFEFSMVGSGAMRVLGIPRNIIWIDTKLPQVKSYKKFTNVIMYSAL